MDNCVEKELLSMTQGVEYFGINRQLRIKNLQAHPNINYEYLVLVSFLILKETIQKILTTHKNIYSSQLMHIAVWTTTSGS